MSFTRWSKFWITVTIISLLVYDFRWIYGVVGIFQSVFTSSYPFAQVVWWRLWVDYVTTGIIGNGLRLVETIIALIAVYAVWGPKPASFLNVKKTVSVALLFEAIYWLLTLPVIFIEIFYVETAQIFMLGLVIQILIAAPPLIILANKVWRYTEPDMTSVLKWAGIAAIGYLTGLWFNDVFRWSSMTQSVGFLLTGTTSIGFIGVAVTLSLSLIFAVVAFYMFKRHNTKLAIKLSGVALILLSLNFVVFIIYSALTNSLNSLILVEFWPITVLGLGLGMLRGKI